MTQGRFVIPFSQLRMTDVDIVGGKNASLGELLSQLTEAGIRVPDGFATTAEAFRVFLKEGGLDKRIEDRLSKLDVDDVKELAKAGAEIREWIEKAPFPAQLEKEIREHYEWLKGDQKEISVAVRSSATAEDLPDASFAGQQETYLNVVGLEQVFARMKEVFASLYNDRAISYRVHKGFDPRGDFIVFAVAGIISPLPREDGPFEVGHHGQVATVGRGNTGHGTGRTVGVGRIGIVAVLGHHIVSVSYTHLTLPTN